MRDHHNEICTKFCLKFGYLHTECIQIIKKAFGYKPVREDVIEFWFPLFQTLIGLSWKFSMFWKQNSILNACELQPNEIGVGIKRPGTARKVFSHFEYFDYNVPCRYLFILYLFIFPSRVSTEWFLLSPKAKIAVDIEILYCGRE